MTEDDVGPDFRVSGAPKATEDPPPSDQIVALARQAFGEVTPLTPAPIVEELGELLSLSETAERLGVTEAEVATMISERQLLAYADHAAKPLVPAFQISADGISPAIVGVLELLAPVCSELQTLLVWFCAPKDELSGDSPAGWLRREEADQPLLLAAARDAARLA
jgi:hypothetical protein